MTSSELEYSDDQLFSDDYYDSDAYNISVKISSVSQAWSTVKYHYYLACYTSYVLVFILDQCRSKKYLNSSFFIIQFVCSIFGIFRSLVFVFPWSVFSFPRPVLLSMNHVILTISHACSFVHSLGLLIISVNRYSAVLHPITFKKLWSNRHTVITMVAAVVVSCALAVFYQIHLQYLIYFNMDRNVFVSSFIFLGYGLVFASLLVTASATLQFSQKGTLCTPQNNFILKAEKKLLKLTFFLSLLNTIETINAILLRCLPVKTYYFLGKIVHDSFLLGLNLLSAVDLGGTIVLLFLTSNHVRNAYYRLPVIAQVRQLILFIWKKNTHRTSEVAVIKSAIID